MRAFRCACGEVFGSLLDYMEHRRRCRGLQEA
jgi:hypothetical protein